MSDVHYMLNDLPLPKQMQEFGVFSPGHEGAGVVVKVGEQVKGWKVGDRAGVKPVRASRWTSGPLSGTLCIS